MMSRCCTDARLYAVAVAVLAAVLITACGSSNEGTLASPDRNPSDMFTVSVIDGPGTYEPQVAVRETAAEVTVTVNATNAENLAGAYFHLHYDPALFTPKDVEFGDLLGDEVVTLALTEISEIVPVGVMQIAALNEPVSGSGEIATVTFARTPFTGVRSVSQSPQGSGNTVDDLTIVAQSDTTATLRWTEKNAGDYNNDSLVGVSDLTPIGINFGKQVSASNDPLKVGLCDGNKDDYITVGDITTIGQNFGNMLSGYKLYKDADGSNPYSDGLTAIRDNYADDTDHPIIYTYEASRQPGFVSYTVRPAAADDIANPGPVSEAAELKDDPGAPEPPTDVTAVSSATTGHQTVKVSWTASTSTDVASYVISRKLESESDWGEPIDIGSLTSYTDNDDTFLEQPYVYRVYAKDFTDAVSSYALSNAVTPYFVEGPDAPTNVVAIQDCGTANAILVQWDSPADMTGVIGFQVYRKAPGETSFSAAFYKSKYDEEHLDTGLTSGEYYEYYLKSVGSEADSDPSNTAGAYPCEYVPEIHITGLTTDKTTHCGDGSDGVVSNLAVTTDETPTSVEWTATAGTINGSGSTATWEPGTSLTAQKVTVTCTAHLDTAQDTQTINLYVTAEKIKSPTSGTNSFIDFNDLTLMEPLADGGAVVDNRPLSYYINGKNVVLFNLFGIWCYYCKLELPDFHDWMGEYGNEDFYIVIDSDDSTSEMVTYLNNPQFGTGPFNRFHVYCRDGAAHGNYWTKYGKTTGYPHNVLFDRDGYIRKWKTGAILDDNVQLWEDSFKELLGVE
ncbi:redoxin domain-containing protein [bacterium]|nr:redoxin domain-containing protein [bacterium]